MASGLTRRKLQSLIATATVPKTRRPKFALGLKIIDLNNVPLVTGTSSVKWHLPSSTSAEHRGRTSKELIKDHKVTWDYTKQLTVRLTADRTGLLQESEIHFEVLQEYSSGARGERITLGNVRLNLAEYVEDGEGADGEGVTRRYLMQESKINSTLKICISLRQTEGDRNFIAPPLRTAPVFGGIAGIISSSGEPTSTNDLDPDVATSPYTQIPSISSKTRELGELQDMYRQTLAASWAAQAGELPADECIEDIFTGGTGWAKGAAGSSGGEKEEEGGRGGRAFGRSLAPGKGRGEDSAEDGDSGSESRTLRGHARGPSLSGSGGGSAKGVEFGHRRVSSKDKNGAGSGATSASGLNPGVSGRASIEQQVRRQSGEAAQRDSRSTFRNVREVDECEVREDLRSWEIGVEVG